MRKNGTLIKYDENKPCHVDHTDEKRSARSAAGNDDVMEYIQEEQQRVEIAEEEKKRVDLVQDAQNEQVVLEYMNETPALTQTAQKKGQETAKSAAKRKPIDRTDITQTRGQLEQEFRDYPEVYQTQYDKLVRFREWSKVTRIARVQAKKIDVLREEFRQQAEWEAELAKNQGEEE